MNANLVRSILGPAAALAAMTAAGCVFNATRITTEKSGETSSASVNVASIDLGDRLGNITVSGTADSLVKATLTVSEMAIQGSGETAADQLTVTVTPLSGVATVGFTLGNDKDLWELLRFEEATLVANRSLDVWAKTSSGNITLSGINGFVDLESTSGNVSADVVHGCYISVTSGNIEATLAPDSTFASATFNTTSGNITITVPKSLSANLDLTTTSGVINTPKGNRTTLNGGDSTAVITCSATSGNITIKEE
jgi:Putative adhesin